MFAKSLAGTSDPAPTRACRNVRTIAEQGPRAFYEGEFAEKAVAHLSAHGAGYMLEDFARYQATESKAL